MTLGEFEDVIDAVVVVYRDGITTLASGNPRRARIALGFCGILESRLPSALTVAVTTVFRSDWGPPHVDSWRVLAATSSLEPRKVPRLREAAVEADDSWGFRTSRLKSDVSPFQTALPGPLIRRLRRGVAATNASAASGDVHEHQRHKGIYTFEKPHC